VLHIHQVIFGSMESSPAMSKAALVLYHVAVGNPRETLDTLVELIAALQSEDRSMSMVICVSSRDHLDEVLVALYTKLTEVGRVNVWCLHSDLGEREILTYANQFRDVSRYDIQPGATDDEQQQQQEYPLNILVTTDAPLQTLLKMNSDPLCPTLMIHYNLPKRREEYTRRNGVILGSRKSGSEGNRRIGICFVEAGKLEELHHFEEFAERTLREMPVHVKDILI
jgi:superfamily II DNA/RNA helicase